MAYIRPPNTVLAGKALKQNPPPNPKSPAGALSLTLDVDNASKTTLGAVIVGDNISVTPEGVISVPVSPSSISINIVTGDYLASADDYYIGATSANSTITLPTGILGKNYYIKNQSSGVITVQGTGGQTLDTSVSKTLNSEAGILVVFDGTRWNIL